jgi:cell division protein FtsB
MTPRQRATSEVLEAAGLLADASRRRGLTAEQRDRLEELADEAAMVATEIADRDADARDMAAYRARMGGSA